jgi:hypothetical protein
LLLLLVLSTLLLLLPHPLLHPLDALRLLACYSLLLLLLLLLLLRRLQRRLLAPACPRTAAAVGLVRSWAVHLACSTPGSPAGARDR